jgi:hypothetical protein
VTTICEWTGDELGADAAGRSPCRAADLVVRQSATGRVVEGKPEYAVEVVEVYK